MHIMVCSEWAEATLSSRVAPQEILCHERLCSCPSSIALGQELFGYIIFLSQMHNSQQVRRIADKTISKGTGMGPVGQREENDQWKTTALI